MHQTTVFLMGKIVYYPPDKKRQERDQVLLCYKLGFVLMKILMGKKIADNHVRAEFLYDLVSTVRDLNIEEIGNSPDKADLKANEAASKIARNYLDNTKQPSFAENDIKLLAAIFLVLSMSNCDRNSLVVHVGEATSYIIDVYKEYLKVGQDFVSTYFMDFVDESIASVDNLLRP